MKTSQLISIFTRSFFLQTGWNYLKYQNLGLLFIMWPFLKKLYRQDPDAIPSVASRYLATFNTQPVLASFCLGALAREEERIATTKDMKEFNEEILQWNAIKRGLSITAASIGDRLFWGTLKPLTLLLALFIWLMLGVHVFELQPEDAVPLSYMLTGCLAAFIAFNAVALFVKWEGIKLGYQANEKSCFGLIHFDWNRTIYNAKKIGLVLTIFLILLGVYYYLHTFQHTLDVQFVMRAVLVLFFVCLCFVTRRLGIPSVYLYLAATTVFNIVCYL